MAKQNNEQGLTRPQTASEQADQKASEQAAAAGQETGAATPATPVQDAGQAAPATPGPGEPGSASNADAERGTVDTSKAALNTPTVADNTPNGRKAAKDVNVGDSCTITNLLDAPLRDFETDKVYEFNVPTKTEMTSFLDGQREAGRIRVEK